MLWQTMQLCWLRDAHKRPELHQVLDSVTEQLSSSRHVLETSHKLTRADCPSISRPGQRLAKSSGSDNTVHGAHLEKHDRHTDRPNVPKSSSTVNPPHHFDRRQSSPKSNLHIRSGQFSHGSARREGDFNIFERLVLPSSSEPTSPAGPSSLHDRPLRAASGSLDQSHQKTVVSATPVPISRSNRNAHTVVGAQSALAVAGPTSNSTL